ncbi:CDGSH iron-sulfur domain-containing protein 1 [Portunus trituberculatus]|uniref:CDGSH iron-sulfur domain-containing protein 2 homologue n=1 Tax=Portunus trituberculatus TaxID=210409 RepID=A0A5B7GB69_PORTR|nr:CDGSH iron-sulfur domain-containing protein 1 [Portunus trituberculatus]
MPRVVERGCYAVSTYDELNAIAELKSVTGCSTQLVTLVGPSIITAEEHPALSILAVFKYKWTSDWAALLPLGVTCVAVGFGAKILFDKQFGTPVNPSIRKGESKVVDSVDIEDLGNKAVFCRCWRSSKPMFPSSTSHTVMGYLVISPTRPIRPHQKVISPTLRSQFAYTR